MIEDARCGHGPGPRREEAQRRLDAGTARGLDAGAGGEPRDLTGVAARVLARDRHGDDLLGQPGEGLEERQRVLGRQHAADQHEGSGVALLHLGDSLGQDTSPLRIVAAVEPELGARRSGRRQPTPLQGLQSCRPIRLDVIPAS